MMKAIQAQFHKLQDFFALARSLDGAYLQHITAHNGYASTLAAALIITMESTMIVRVFIKHPAIDTPASRVYLTFYTSLLALAIVYLLVQRKFTNSSAKTYWLQFGCVAGYLLWNMLLNSYDLYRNGRGSCLALVSALIFASILLHFRPQHMMILQGTIFLVFFVLNEHLIEDKINACIAVMVAVAINLLFHMRNIQMVDHVQRVTQMHAHLEKEQMDGAMQYLRRLQDAQTQTAIYRHDMRHTLTLIEQLTLQGNLEKLHSFVSDSQKNLQALTPTFYCEHESANLILGSFAQRAAKANVAFETETRLPAKLPLANTELCALLSNLLENALHSACEVDDAALRRIYIKALIREKQLFIVVENGYTGKVVMQHGRPVSQNGEKHGFGVQSVINVVERHQGYYMFETNDSLFFAKVLLHLTQ